jgi:ribonuclease T2
MSASCYRFLVTVLLMLVIRTAAADPVCLAPTALDGDSYDVRPEDERNACLQKAVTTPPNYHMLVLSWSPSFCRSKQGANGKVPADLIFQCRNNNFGWVVHGLWAELNSPENCIADPSKPSQVTPLHPRYCGGNLPQLPASLIKSTMCTMPGSRLIQGEWEKHGACIFKEPVAYFAKIKDLKAQLVLPDDILPQTELFRWMREHNAMLRDVSMDYNPRGSELHICYSTNWAPINCPGKPSPPMYLKKKSITDK